MFTKEQIEHNRQQLEELKKLPYEELCKMEEEILNNPNSKRIDILNIIFARGHKSSELGIPGYTLEEVLETVLDKDYIEQTGFHLFNTK